MIMMRGSESNFHRMTENQNQEGLRQLFDILDSATPFSTLCVLTGSLLRNFIHHSERQPLFWNEPLPIKPKGARITNPNYQARLPII